MLDRIWAASAATAASMLAPGPLTLDSFGRPCAIDVPVAVLDGTDRDRCPYIGDEAVTGMTLLHVRFAPSLTATTARDVLGGYRDRLAALADAVTETERSFDDDRLGRVPIVELLTDPVYVLAERWWRQ